MKLNFPKHLLYFSYVAVETVNNEIYVCTRRAALNMAYQEMLKSGKSVEPVCELPGNDLMGAQLKAPMTSYPHVYALPMMTIKENKGTGVVTSVPSDAPDDYAALVDIQNKAHGSAILKFFVKLFPRTSI